MARNWQASGRGDLDPCPGLRGCRSNRLALQRGQGGVLEARAGRRLSGPVKPARVTTLGIDLAELEWLKRLLAGLWAARGELLVRGVRARLCQ